MIQNDKKTADAFASSWNNLPTGSVYTPDQFADWLLPLTKEDIQGKDVLELGYNFVQTPYPTWNKITNESLHPRIRAIVVI